MRYKWLTQTLAPLFFCSLLLTQPALAMDAQYRSLSQEERQAIYQEKALTPEDVTFLNLVPFSMNDQPEAFAGDELLWKNAFDVGTVALAGLFAVGTVYNLLTDEAAEAGYTSYLLVPLLYVGGRLIGNYHTTAYRELNNKALQKDLGLSKSQISWKWTF
jgi:hypothetical protein